LSKPCSVDDGVVTAFRDGEVNLRSARREDGYTFSGRELDYQGVAEGDLVFHALDGFAGAVGISKAAGKCTPVYHVCAALSKVDVRFVAYALRAAGDCGFLAVQAGNVRQRSVDFRTWDQFARIPLPLPPHDVQRKASDYLDKELARIALLLVSKKRMVGLLEERQRAIVQNSLAPFHASIPLRYVFRIVHGGTPASDTQNWDGHNVWVTPTDLGRKRGPWILESERRLTDIGVRASSIVPAESLVLSTRAPIGTVAVAGVPLSTNQGCKSLVPLMRLDSRFFYYQLSHRRPELEMLGMGSTFVELSGHALGSVRLAVPPLERQRLVADALDDNARRHEELLSFLSRQIALLSELRRALITRVVTGQHGVTS
jgi:type I restriction enzyme S subunit